MARLYRTGHTLEEIGQHFGITRERVRQIIKKHFGYTAKSGGQHIHARRRKLAAEASRDARAYERYGCTWAQYVEARDIGRRMMAEGRSWYQTPLGAFGNQKRNANSRGIGWQLTFWQWWAVWQESGHWDNRGRGRGYQMCRYRDEGPYAVGNVYIANGVDNMKDYWARCRIGGSARKGNSARQLSRATSAQQDLIKKAASYCGSLSALGRLIGLSQPEISNLRHGKKPFRADHMDRIEAATNGAVTKADFLAACASMKEAA